MKVKQLDKLAISDPESLPQLKEFSLEEASLLAQGLYKHIEEDDEPEIVNL